MISVDSPKVDTTGSDDVIKRYYRERAPVYDRVYMYPEKAALSYTDEHGNTYQDRVTESGKVPRVEEFPD